MQPIPFVCPICKGALTQQSDAYYCAHDQRAFPVTLDIPDFRVFPDGATERDPREAKVARLAEEYPKRTFAELVEFYYHISSEIRPDLAQSQIRHVLSGPARAEIALRDIQQQSQISLQDSFLEIGCGSGGFLVAASRVFHQAIGLDIALWWLLIAKKRLEEAGYPANLICAFAERLPFPIDSFQLVVGSDVIEHTPKQVELMIEAYRVLANNGALFLATPNRWSLTPEPHVKVWGVGFLPRAWRAPYVRLVRKVPYEKVITLNYFDARALIAQTQFGKWKILLPEFHPDHVAQLPAWQRAVVPIYHALKALPLVKGLVYLFGPLFYIIGIKRND